MRNILFCFTKIIVILFLINISSYRVHSDEIGTVIQKLENLQRDINTLEKAVYSRDIKSVSSTSSISNSANDVLTKHLLKLSELEEQFKNLTNNFEEINFKLDKLSSRITKIQTDNQVRFQDKKSGNPDLLKSKQ